MCGGGLKDEVVGSCLKDNLLYKAAVDSKWEYQPTFWWIPWIFWRISVDLQGENRFSKSSLFPQVFTVANQGSWTKFGVRIDGRYKSSASVVLVDFQGEFLLPGDVRVHFWLNFNRRTTFWLIFKGNFYYQAMFEYFSGWDSTDFAFWLIFEGNF